MKDTTEKYIEDLNIMVTGVANRADKELDYLAHNLLVNIVGFHDWSLNKICSLGMSCNVNFHLKSEYNGYFNFVTLQI